MSFFLFCIFFIFLIIFICFYISKFNTLKKLSNRVNESISGIDVALAKRYDVLTKMVTIVKEYVNYESDILYNITQLRSNPSIDELNKANNSLDDNFKKVYFTVEKYPDIKANENFKLLQKSVIDVEEHLQAARRLYNSNVSDYNQFVESFPSLIVAKINGAKRKDFFIMTDNEKKETDIKL